jgi:tellurite methyltransferase
VHRELSSDDLFGVFRQLREDNPNMPIASFYEDEFYEYLREAAWGQMWDIDPMMDLCKSISITRLADLGCGDGRVMHHLSQLGVSRPMMGVDLSPSARHSFANRKEGSSGAFSRSVWLNVDLLGPDHIPDVDLLVMGSVSINSFASTEELEAFLAFCARSLPVGGALILLAYRAEVLPLFEGLSGALDAVPCLIDGTRRLLWRGVRYSKEKFLQNYFIEGARGIFPGVLGALRERVWTSDEVRCLAANSGLKHEISLDAFVDSGGAAGWSCDCMLFKKVS